jgi:hypothetical protein
MIRDQLLELVDAIQRVEPPRWTPLAMETDQATCHCGKRHDITPEMWVETGVRRALDPACPDCARSFRGTARVVCVVCRPPRVVARMGPGTDPKTGLVIRAGGFYHIDGCPACKPGVLQSLLIEQVIALKNQGKTV